MWSFYTSVKSIEFLADFVGCHWHFSSTSSRKVHDSSKKTVTQFSVYLFILCPDIFQKFFLLLKGLFCIGTYQHNGRNSCNNIQIAEHIRFQLLICTFTVDICIYHEFVYPDLLVNTFDHHFLIYRLVISPDKITVEIHIQIIQILYIRKRFKSK